MSKPAFLQSASGDQPPGDLLDGKTRITATVAHVRFYNPENGYAVLVTEPQGKQRGFTVVGTLMTHGEARKVAGLEIEAEGQWDHHPKFGRQFAADSIIERMPTDSEGMVTYLAQTLPHVGRKNARAIVDRFGDRIQVILDHTPEKLAEIRGITPKHIEEIREAWSKARASHRVMLFLTEIGITPGYAKRIYDHVANRQNLPASEVIRRIRENPYQMTRIRGIGFKIADAAAARLKVPADSRFRIKAGLRHVLDEASTSGHTRQEEGELVENTAELLKLRTKVIVPALDEALRDRELIRDGKYIALPHLHRAERTIAGELARLMEGESLLPPDTDLGPALAWADIPLDDTQKRAVEMVFRHKVSILTGGPGMGKSALQKIVVDIAGSHGVEKHDIQLCAPTGRAAQQVGQYSGMEASTIHRAIGLRPDAEPVDLDCKLLIIDEFSMADVPLVARLLKCTPSNATVLLVGDQDQLPSVGAGNVLGDLIRSGTVPVTRLTEVYRQGKGSAIARGASAINAGYIPSFERDLHFDPTPEQDPEAVFEQIDRAVMKLVDEDGYRCEDIQILSPMKGGAVGIERLNAHFQERFNPPGNRPEVVFGDTVYRAGDRVIQMRNNYKLDIFNGDIGYITDIRKNGKEIEVVFTGKDVPVTLDKQNLKDMGLAYAITVHKSQGGQFPAVVMPVCTQHYIMLTRNLLYTGVTRAQEVCCLVGQKKAVAVAVGKESNISRETGLVERLQEILPPLDPVEDGLDEPMADWMTP